MLNESFSRTRCLEQQHAIESQVCDPGIQRTCNFGFQKEEIKTHFLKTKDETCKKKQKSRIGNILQEMIDERKDEGQTI